MELQIIQNKIYDLAELYDVTTSALNQAVKRNIKRFPSDFMSQLTREDLARLKSQFVISSWGGTRKLPSKCCHVVRIKQQLDEFVEETEGKFDDIYVALAQLSLQKQLPSKERPRIGFKKE